MSLSLRVPRFWTRPLLARLGFLALFCALIGADEPLEALFVFLGLSALMLGGRYVMLAKTPPFIELADDALVLPRSAERSLRDRVPYRELANVEVLGGRRGETLLVQTLDRHYLYPLAAFSDASQLHELLARLQERISREGAELRALFKEREQIGRALALRRAWMTRAILLVLGLAFALQSALGADKDELRLIALGANVPALVRAGQWERLFVSSLLHGNLVHIGVNALSLWSLGALLERLLGGPGFFVVYVGAAVMGGVFSMGLSGAFLSVGASGAIFGLLGALLVIHLRYRETMPLGVRQSRQWWLTILLINGGLPFVFRQIDWAAHLGGFLAGAAITYVLSFGLSLELVGRKLQPIVAVLCLAMLVFAGASVLRVAQRALHPELAQQDEVVMLTGLIEADHASPIALNDIAWMIAERDGASEAALALAEQAAERSVSMVEAENQPMVLDTLAAVLHRRGEHERAVRIEREALAVSEHPPFAHFVVKFSAALPRPETHFALTSDGEGLTVSLPEALERCTTLVARQGEVSVVAYLPKGTSGSLGIRRVVSSKKAMPLRADTPFELLLTDRCLDAEDRLAPGYFSALP